MKSQIDQDDRTYKHQRLLVCKRRLGASHRMSFAIICSWAMIAAGCDQGPRVGKVAGVISYKGQPMKGIEVSFDPVAIGRRSSAVTDGGGAYELQYTRGREGALVGEHQVRLVWPAQSEADLLQRRKFPIPSSFNTDTTLVVEVKRGNNVFDVNIETQ